MSKAELLLGECLEIMKMMDTYSVDAVITDPPYNTGKDYGLYKDNLPPEDYKIMMDTILHQSRRIAKTVSFFVSGKLLPLYMELMPTSHPVIIYKRAAGVLKGGWRLQYHILFCEGQPKIPSRDLWDNIRLPGEGYFFREERYNHPGITSLELTKRIVSTMTNPGDTILDPFMGSGTTGIACMQLGMNFVGIELNEGYFDVAVDRIKHSYGVMKNV